MEKYSINFIKNVTATLMFISCIAIIGYSAIRLNNPFVINTLFPLLITCVFIVYSNLKDYVTKSNFIYTYFFIGIINVFSYLIISSVAIKLQSPKIFYSTIFMVLITMVLIFNKEDDDKK